MELTGLALVLEEFVLKLRDSDGAFKDRSWTIVNVVFGSGCFLLLSCAILSYALRSYTAHRLGKRWWEPILVRPRNSAPVACNRLCITCFVLLSHGAILPGKSCAEMWTHHCDAGRRGGGDLPC